MAYWTPRLDGKSGPLHLQLFNPLQQDIFEQHLKAGDRLPPQRQTADQLGLSLGTVSKAYQHAINCGLVKAHVGRGTIVAGIPEQDSADNPRELIDLQLNKPPLPLTRSLLLEASHKACRNLWRDTDLQYPPNEGLLSQRSIISDWFSTTYGIDLAAERTAITLGAQQAISLAIAATTKVGQRLYCDPATFAGIKVAADYMGRRITPLPTDAQGILPEAFEEIARNRNHASLITIPTLQNPTGITLSDQRRKRLAEIAVKYESWIIECDIYRFLQPDAPQPIHAHAPDRTLYINSFSKCLCPDLRVGILTCPEQLKTHIRQGLQAGGWATPPLSVEIICTLLKNGEAERFMQRLRDETKLRAELVTEHLGNFFPPKSSTSFHQWHSCTLEEAERLITRARAENVILTPAQAMTIDSTPLSPSGVRVCLGSVQSRKTFLHALKRLSRAFGSRDNPAGGII